MPSWPQDGPHSSIRDLRLSETPWQLEGLGKQRGTLMALERIPGSRLILKWQRDFLIHSNVSGRRTGVSIAQMRKLRLIEAD